MPPTSKISEMWSPAEKAEKTMAFIAGGLRYFDVTVRIKELADNAAVVVDEGGMFRVIPWASMSFASYHIAQQNQGAIVVLKIRSWA